VISQPLFHLARVMHFEVAEDEQNFAVGILDNRLKKSISTSAFIAPSNTFQRTLPWLVTVEMMLNPSRLLFTRTTGV
jgi:hypothetical protein